MFLFSTLHFFKISWPWNLPDSTTMKSTRFHEICQISWPWILPDSTTMKYTAYLAFSDSGRGVLGVPWNLLNSTMQSARFHIKYTAYLAFSGRPWNLPDFTTMKSARFHEIHTMKSTGFHMKYTAYLAFSGSGRGVLGVPWNLPDSTMKSGRFHMKYTAYLAFSGRP